jgi:hypothetical protein
MLTYQVTTYTIRRNRDWIIIIVVVVIAGDHSKTDTADKDQKRKRFLHKVVYKRRMVTP